MLNFSEFKHRPDRLSDLLPWAALVGPGIMLNKDGSFQATLRYRGPDLDSSTEAELINISARVNNVLRRLGSGWAIYCDALRSSSNAYPISRFPEPISYLIDQERKLMFEAENHFESRYYLTLIYLPPSDSANRLAATFVESSAGGESLNYAHVLRSFQADVERVAGLLETIFTDVQVLPSEELLTYLHSIISEKYHAVSLPSCPMYLDALLTDTPLLTGFEPRLGNLHIKVVSVRGFPATSQPGLLVRLNRLAIPYRWVTRFICLDKAEAEAELKKFKRRWFSKRKGVLTLLKETFCGAESVMVDSDAVNKAQDSDAALQELASDMVSFGYFTASVVLMAAEKSVATSRAVEVERIINSHGFVTRVEDINAVDAWLAAIPGNCRNNVRRPLLHTLNLSHLMPLSAVWAGPEQDAHLQGPALLYAKTGGSTQFRFVPHVGDVGHTLIIGPTGAGKSVLLNLIEAQFLKYADAQIYIFDKGGSARTLTAGIGGDYFDLGSEEEGISFQPLAQIDQPRETRFAHEWLIDLIRQENVDISPKVKEDLWTALNSLASAPINERTIFGLTVILQNAALRQALLPYTMQGAHGRLLDQNEDTLRLSNWQCFEMETLMETPSVVMPVLSYLFHRLEHRFDGRPTLLVLDEAWLFLDNDTFASKIREWLKVLRKANVSVVFATQSLADVDQSSIAPTIKEACLTKIYLPNTAATNDDAHAFYSKFGLNERQIKILAQATPKRDYYYSSPQGSRLFELGLEELALAYCANTSKEQQRQVRQLLNASRDTADFNNRYLSSIGMTWALNSLLALKEKKRAA